MRKMHWTTRKAIQSRTHTLRQRLKDPVTLANDKAIVGLIRELYHLAPGDLLRGAEEDDA